MKLRQQQKRYRETRYLNKRENILNYFKTKNQQNAVEILLNDYKKSVYSKRNFKRLINIEKEIKETGTLDVIKYIKRRPDEFSRYKKRLEMYGKDKTKNELLSLFRDSDEYLQDKELVISFNEKRNAVGWYRAKNSPEGIELKKLKKQIETEKIGDIFS